MTNFNLSSLTVFAVIFSTFIVFTLNAECPSSEKVHQAMLEMPKGFLEVGNFVLERKVVKVRYSENLPTGNHASKIKNSMRTLNNREMASVGLDPLKISEIERICSYDIKEQDVLGSFILID